MAEDIKINISANANGAVAGVNKTAAAVEGLKRAIQGISRVMGIIGLITSVVAVFRRFSEASKKAEEELVNLGKAMTQAADEAAKLDTTVAGMEAIGRAAANAGVSADALNDILDKYKAHEITFSELATAIGSTSEAIDKLEGRTSPGRAGRDYLTGLARDAEQRKQQETEKKGLRAATEVIRKTGGGDNSPEANAAWDTLMKAARGDPARAAALYDENKSWKNRTQVGVMGFATSMGQLPAAAARYQAGVAEDANRRAASRAAHDAEVARLRKAKEDQDALTKLQEEAKDAAMKAARQAAEAARAEEHKEEQRIKAHTAEITRQEQADEDRRTKKADVDRDISALKVSTQEKIDAITVAAPGATSSYGAIGGIMGNQGNNAERVKEQRAATLESIQKEHTVLLAKIAERLGE